MELRQNKRFAAAVWLLGLVLFAAGETLAIANRVAGSISWDDLSWFFLVAILGFVTIGALILSRYPAHVVGWLLCVVGLLFEVSFFGIEYGIYANETNPGSLPFAREMQAISWLGGTAFFLMTTQLLLHFPDGKTPTPRWRWVALLGLAGVIGGSASEFLRESQLEAPLEEWSNPTGVSGIEGALNALSAVSLGVIAACGLAGAASVVLRWRRATGIQREQLKWVAASGVLFIASWIFLLAGNAFGIATEPIREGLLFVGVGSIPFAAGLAILRYRLYDIDWIINRTLVYVPLTAVLAGVYIALTGVFRTLLTEGTGGNSDFAIAMSTVIVVSMLTPVKNYLQALVDRHFKDSQDPARALHKLAVDTRSAVEVLDLNGYLMRFLSETVSILEASGAALRLHNSARMLSHGEVSDEPAVVLPLRRDGRELGVLEVGERHSGRPYTDAELEALRESSEVIAYLLSLQLAIATLQER